MQFKTADFAYWTIEEYTRPDGTKPPMNSETAESIRVFCSIADLFVQKMGSGSVTTDVDPDTEHLIISFSSEGVGNGRLEIENVFKKETSD